MKVNPKQSTVFTCKVIGNVLPCNNSVVLEREGRSTAGITFRNASETATGRLVMFDVDWIGSEEPMTCRILMTPEPSLTIIADTYGLNFSVFGTLLDI